MKRIALPLVALALALPGIASADEALAKKNNCLKCHAVDKKKDGPAFKEVSKKMKGNEAKLADFILKGGKVGNEDHDPIKSKSADDAKTLAKWILSM
ncbi:MAG TPA: cytochrome C [Usitatibacteraceae bacterium]|nr:cytochrome C [Usitatibacteraceae bacterium]